MYIPQAFTNVRCRTNRPSTPLTPYYGRCA